MLTTQTQCSWLLFPKPNPQARLRLFCFPYAGGGAHIFQSWPAGLPGPVELCAVQLPGRGSRWNERPFTDIKPLVQAIAAAMYPYLDKTFALFGHSMGALIAFEVARELNRRSGVMPTSIFASGRGAPHILSKKPKTHLLSDSDFKEKIRSLNGTPPVLMENEELMQIVLPVLRSDFTICENYTYRKGQSLNCHLVAYGGTEDAEVCHNELTAWSEHTTGVFLSRMFSGGHFFLHSAKTQLLQAISERLEFDQCTGCIA